MKCILRHKWGKWTKAIDTGNCIYRAQFRSCAECNKIKVRFISMTSIGSICEVKAEKINEALAH